MKPMFRHQLHVDQKLIGEIENRPILWNRTLSDYRKVTLREAAWKEVSRVLSISSSECKHRWRTLRDSFVKYHRSKNNGMKGNEPCRKRMWIFYDLMLFLLPHIEARESMTMESLESAMDENSGAGDNELQFSRQTKLEAPEEMNFDIGESSISNPLDLDDFSADGSGALDYFESKSSSSKTTDADEQFLLSYAPVLRRLPPQKNAQARLRIQQVLYEVEFGNSEK